MRACIALLVLAAGCSTELGTRHAVDATPAIDATTDAAVARDASADVSLPVDAPPRDAYAADVCTPPYDCASCCGPAPDGCGGTLACAACVDDLWCSPSTSHFQAVVSACVQDTMNAHPEYFDPVMFRDTSSWLVIDDAAYTAAVVMCCNAMGLVCISDPNDDHEMRVRSPSNDLAENYGIRVHSTNRTWTRFMGGVCATRLF